MWTLNASRADIIEGSDRVKLNDVVLWVENKDMTIYSPEGFYNMESRDLTLNGKIKAVTKGYTIITESVEWNQSKGEIKTKEAVKIESKKFNVEGVGMEADSEQKVRILKNVKATFFVSFFICIVLAGSVFAEEKTEQIKGPILITSQTLLSDNKARTALFEGSVVAKTENMTLYSDKMLVYYAEGSGNVTKIDAEGSVKLVKKTLLLHQRLQTISQMRKRSSLQVSRRRYRKAILLQGQR